MVRETRHLWVGNLPDNIREDRIREHFKRYGRVQNVKLLGRPESASAAVGANGASGICATVAFMDIKSASKAHNTEHVLDERTLTTEYYEPAAIPSTAGAPSAGSSPAGSGYSGSSSSVNSVPVPSSAPRYHLSGGEDSSGATTCPIAASAAAPANWRGTNDSATEYCRRGNTPATYGRYQRNNSSAPFSTPPSNVERTTPHNRWYASSERAGATGGESTPSTPGGGTESGRRRRNSGSASSRSDSSSPEPSDTSRASTPPTQPPLSHHNNHRTPTSLPHQWASTASGRPLAICVRNLPTRSTDTSLKDGLYHEYKKHGKVVWVKVVGQNADRYAVVRFKKPSDVEKALEVSQDKLFFGCKISVAPHQSGDDDAESAKPYETDIDEYHPKATRTLFIGNLEKDVTQQQLRDKFKHFGRIIEIDIKKGSGGGAGYAFCQYASISSVVEAIRAMDGEYVGGSRVKLGFGKPVATACVWVDGLTEHTEKQVLGAVSRCGAATSVCVDRAAGAALVHFEQAAAAGAAVRELRRVAAAASAAEPDLPRLCVDYASRECQDAFYEQLEKHGGSAALAGSERLSSELTGRYLPSTRHDSLRFEGSRSRASSFGRSCSRTPRYSGVEPYDPVDYAADRRYRVYDEPGSSPPPDDAVPFEDRLQSVVVSPHRGRRHRRDSSPDDRRHSKERLQSVPRSSGRGNRKRQQARRRLRRKHRRDGDGSGSRAGTPLRDEPDAPPAEPRRPPRDRPALPMCLPLPKFAAQIPRAAPPAPRPAPPPPAPDSPPRPPSVSSSSAGSAPHSPSLEERIRSLDEKYEKWSGSRAQAEAPDRARLRHRLLEVDINEVKPSEVVRSLLAKRSVFDEDSERLEVSARAPSPPGTPRSRSSGGGTPRALRYPAPPPGASTPARDPSAGPDPRLRRLDRFSRSEKTCNSENDYSESRGRPRTPSLDRSRQVSCERRSPSALIDVELESRSRDSASGTCDAESKSSFDPDEKETGEIQRERLNSSASDSPTVKSDLLENIPMPLSKHASDGNCDEDKQSEGSLYSDENCARDVMDMLLKKVENGQKFDATLETSRKLSKYEFRKDEDHCKTALESEKFGNVEKFKKLDCPKNQMFDLSLGIKELIEHELQNHINESITAKSIEHELQNHINESLTIKSNREKTDFSNHSDIMKQNEKDRSNTSSHIFRSTKFEKENIQTEKPLEKSNLLTNNTSADIFSSANKAQHQDIDKNNDDRMRNDRDKVRHNKAKEKYEYDKEKSKNIRNEKSSEKYEKEKKNKEENQTPDKLPIIKGENIKSLDRNLKEKGECEKMRHCDDKPRHMHHRRDSKSEKDKRKDSEDTHIKVKKDDKHKADKTKKENESKRDTKKESESVKSRKSSRDESSREISRKDSTDSSTSRASHELKLKDVDVHDSKEDVKPKMKLADLFVKLEKSKDFPFIKDGFPKIKQENDKSTYNTSTDNHASEHVVKPKADTIDKQRHHSVDSLSVDSKRKERLNSCSSLPSNIGHKRRVSSQENFDLLCDESKKIKSESKILERRESKDSRSGDRHKTTKFSKGHFAKIIESKTKDDKKNQVKPPDDTYGEVRDDTKDEISCMNRPIKKSPKGDSFENVTNEHSEDIHNNLDFLALLELRSSEEDEKQKALRKEMKEKKRIQQLQQIQELQLQHEVELGKLKEDKKLKSEDKKRENAREKRMSTERKSREDKSDPNKRKNRKQLQSSDSSDSDEPKKHSIFDIVDEGPTYISMYDKVKARSCKNMQKQEEEKRQEKIKAKFSQLKQSRAKREEKKRSSWDEDSDSEQDLQRKKSSLDSSDDDSITTQNTKRDKHCSSIEFDENKTEDYFNLPNDEDYRNKLSRKNSRTRIMSDTSDDDSSKHKYANFMRGGTKKVNASDSETLSTKANNSGSYCNDDKITKNSMFNLFGKSDSDDSKLKSSLENENHYKSINMKSYCNDLSSECESVSSSRNADLRRKHKKKQKKYKSTYSEEENKVETSDTGGLDSEVKHKKSIKQRRHSSKKDKRKERIRDSNDTDEGRDENVKLKRDKKSPDNIHTDYGNDSVTNNIKRDGKMEDIFGPLSDESDNDNKHQNNKSDFSSLDYDSNFGINEMSLNSIEKDLKRKREKRRKDKTWFREDDNSLDVDAVSKAIEANLLTVTDDSENIRSGAELKYIDGNLVKDVKAISKLKRDNKEKRKKKKKSREERLGRKDHHYLYHPDSIDTSDHDINDSPLVDTVSNAMLLDIPLPNDNNSADDKMDDCKSLSQSPGLPRLTESPPILIESSQDADVKSTISNTSNTVLSGDDNIEFIVNGKEIEIEQIPMPPPFENIVQDISEVPLPADPAPTIISEEKPDALKSTLASDSDTSEDALMNISVDENESECMVEKPVEKIDMPKADKKPEEKQRAIISQEETEDAVAALLGESFGGKVNTFSSYEETESSSTHQTDIENTTLSTENIPEEDAEEMRQAVQNLNACEMEMKPDTPVSDSDLFIDTDTEEADETLQDTAEKLPSNLLAANPVLNNNSEPPKKVEEPSLEVSNQKSKIEKTTVSSLELAKTPVSSLELAKTSVLSLELKTTQTETNVKNVENDVKIKLARRENVQVITSTATPVITSWTLANNNIREPQQVINIQSIKTSNKIPSETKSPHIAANIVQIKTSQPHVQANNLVKPVMTTTRPSYQVLSPILRPQSSNMQPRPQPSNLLPRPQSSIMQQRPQSSNLQPRLQSSNMQPPTIKIPEPHVLYQKPQGIVISPRISNDPRMQSPKSSPQAEGITSPRLTNMTILTSTPQNSSGMMSPTSKMQRSPGQVTVVRMQQPPLSPIQSLHGVHGPKAMMSPNRPNSVLVQGGPLHYNRLPVTPVLTPISKQINVSGTILQNKSVGVASTPLLSQHINMTSVENRKGDHGNILGNKNENAKIILSPTNLQHSHNPQVMAQNRLITMQNAVHLGNINSGLHLGNKVVINKMNQIQEKRENQMSKSSEHVSHSPFGTPPIIHVAASHASSASIIQSHAKSMMCNTQDPNNTNRGQQGNVIHTLNAQRLITPVSKNNVIQIDKTKITPSVLSMAPMRPATVLTKLEPSGISAVSNVTHTNVSPILLKPISNIRLNTKNERDNMELNSSTINETKCIEKIDPVTTKKPDNEQSSFLLQSSPPKLNTNENIAKCETDFEELLKDTTNEIKVTNNPEKKLEINVGKTTTLITPNNLQDAQNLIPTECKPNQKVQDICTSDSDRDTSESCLAQKEDNISTNDSMRKSDQNNVTPCISSTAVVPGPITIDTTIQSSEIQHEEINIKSNIVSNANEQVPKPREENKTFDFMKENTLENPKKETVKHSDVDDNQIKHFDVDTWNVKDLNIESVIKKVDSLCNDPIDSIQINGDCRRSDSFSESSLEKVTDTSSKPSSEVLNIVNSDFKAEKFNEHLNSDIFNVSAKRSVRSVRGKKGQRGQDRVQTRQISKSSRGTAKRGRGRAKIDKKIKNLASSSASTIPGDIYDFHEDSGDEASKSESRPRLILTIKSPLSGQAGVTATSTLSITQKDQIKIAEKLNREEKNEDFVSPSTNTRKSRRLQEKDVHRVAADEVGEDGGPGLGRSAKRRPIRQAVGKVTNINEKPTATDKRKSPRGNKRTRDRSLSDASVESGDGEARKDETTRDPKVARLDERLAQVETDPPLQPVRPVIQSYTSPATIQPIAAPTVSHAAPIILPLSTPPAAQPSAAPTIVPPAAPLVNTPTAPPAAAPAAPPAALPAVPPSAAPIAPPVISAVPVSIPPAIPTPITKPPKKMISEIAKLASAAAFEAAVQHRASPEPARDGSPAAPATGDAHAGDVRRPMDSMPGAMMPVGATEASDARVQSPALPHRAPDTSRVRVAGRATPILIRVGEGEVCANAGIGGALGAAACVAGASAARFRAGAGASCGAASLPRGAHHPPPDPKPPAITLAVHHHPGAVSRITSIPAISPQGQMPLTAVLVRSPPPAHHHQQTSPVTPSDGIYPHFSHQHYQMYQHHFRATQHEARATQSPFTRTLEAEGSEAPQPPLEHRRPPTARVPRPAHSPSTADRLIMYAAGCGRSPPPAHTSGVPRLTGALPPTGPPGPPHASQVPREADSLQMLLRRYPVMWQGLLALKNDSAAVQMHFVGGSPGVANDTLARSEAGTPMLRIAQRMRLEPAQLEGVHRKMMMENEHCILLALPCGRDHMDVLLQSTNLNAGFITYLQHKQAAGIVNIAPPGHQQAMFTVHVFPSCDFANENLTRIAPDLMHRVVDIAHLLIVIATV